MSFLCWNSHKVNQTRFVHFLPVGIGHRNLKNISMHLRFSFYRLLRFTAGVSSDDRVASSRFN